MEVCRICLSNNDLDNLFQEEDLEKRSETLHFVTGCKIQANDGLPQFVCKTCMILIESAMTLRQLSQDSEAILLRANAEKTKNITSGTPENLLGDREETRNCVILLKKKKIKNPVNIDADEPHKMRKRNAMSQETSQKYLSLAMTPYDHGGPVTCILCHKRLKTLRYFFNHAKTHFAAEHTCQVCGKRFVSQYSMRYHMTRLHGFEKRHPCSYCDFRGVDRDQLRNHERRAHTGERPYVCDVCGGAFSARAGVVQHLRKHFGVKREQCDRCSAMFRSRSELAGHRRRVHCAAPRRRRPTARGPHPPAITVP